MSSELSTTSTNNLENSMAKTPLAHDKDILSLKSSKSDPFFDARSAGSDASGHGKSHQLEDQKNHKEMTGVHSNHHSSNKPSSKKPHSNSVVPEKKPFGAPVKGRRQQVLEMMKNEHLENVGYIDASRISQEDDIQGNERILVKANAFRNSNKSRTQPFFKNFSVVLKKFSKRNS
ncbi:hypothetical protein DASC09_006640 [Saccharomycopsis crataegensis]|uniref:Uncharacterized protein n=1 Tax=Saccharomycopsis crataegensis TaxID=43959 RepID=A0AAV5QF34_9ASCO|nr:hypothetical protein DASC09_006640 [Saccharomycopsis crataegensis]